MIFLLSLVDDDDVREKLNKIYLLYRGTMIHTARSILGETDAEDAVSETFIRIMKNVEKISDIDCKETSAYSVTIVRNISLDILRKRNRLAETPIDDSHEVSAVDFTFENVSLGEVQRLIADCIGELNRDYSDILLLSSQGLSYREIGEALGISEDNAGVRLSRARNALKKKLGDRGYVFHE